MIRLDIREAARERNIIIRSIQHCIKEELRLVTSEN